MFADRKPVEANAETVLFFPRELMPYVYYLPISRLSVHLKVIFTFPVTPLQSLRRPREPLKFT